MSHFTQVHRLRNDASFVTADRARQVAMLSDVILTDTATGNSYRIGDQRDTSSLRFMPACIMMMQIEVIELVVQGRWLERWSWHKAAAQVKQPPSSYKPTNSLEKYSLPATRNAPPPRP